MNHPTSSIAAIKVAMLGCAHTGHAASYMSALEKIPEAKLVGVYDDDAQRGRQYADQYHTSFFSSLPALLEEEDLQAVIVCSATVQHQELVLEAARHGKHVICEKPLATTTSAALEMIEACRSAGVILQTAFVSRFYPMLQTARRLVQSGESGRVVGIVGGNRGVPPLPPLYPEWITDPAQAGGGALLDHSVHVTDAMRFVLGDEVQSVFAHTGTFHNLEWQVEDCALLNLRFRAGAMAAVDPSWSIPENNPYHYDFYLRILTENGTINLDDTRQALTVVSDRPGERPVNSEPFGMDIDLEMVRHFVRCAAEGQNWFPAATGEDGLRALEIALAAYQSAREGQPVDLKLNMEKDL